MPECDAAGRSLFQSQLDVPMLCDSQGADLMASEWKWRRRGVEEMGEEVSGKREWQEKMDGKLWLVCKINFLHNKK